MKGEKRTVGCEEEGDGKRVDGFMALSPHSLSLSLWRGLLVLRVYSVGFNEESEE